jgi:hypothetical protein
MVMADYNDAKMIALGLAEDFPAPPEDDIWSVPARPAGPAGPAGSFGPGGPGGGFRTGGVFSDFERSLGSDLPESEKQTALRRGLAFFEEYPADRDEADAKAEKLSSLIESGDGPGIQAFLSSFPAAEWLSGVFLDDARVDELTEAIGGSGDAVKAAVKAAIVPETQRLVQFRQLMCRIAEVCSL